MPVRTWATPPIAGAKLAHLGPDAQPIVIDALNDPNSDVRHAAVFACGLARDHRAVIPLMAMVGSDKDWSVRFGCIWALGQIGDKSALNTVRGFKFKESNPVTFFSWYGIEIVAGGRPLRLDDPDASQWLGRVENGCSFPSYMAESRMAALRGDFRSLLEMLKLPEDTDRAYAADVLAYYGQGGCRGPHRSNPRCDAWYPRLRRVRPGNAGDGLPEPILRSLLDDPDRNVRARAAEALECLGSNEDFTATSSNDQTATQASIQPFVIDWSLVIASLVISAHPTSVSTGNPAICSAGPGPACGRRRSGH